MSDYLPSRRGFLSASLAATVTASAGCLGAASSRGGAKRTLALTLSREDGPLRETFVVDLSETQPDWNEEAFEATRNGTAYTTQYRRPFASSPEDPTYIKRDGTYYQLDSVVVNEATATHPVLRLSEVDNSSGSAAPDGVAASQLPESDKRAIRAAYFAARARGNKGGAPWGVVQRGGYVYRSDEAINASTLLANDGPDHVTYREQVYAVDITREKFHESVYRATVEPVAETPEQMEAILRAQFVDARVSRDDLSTAAQDILEAAQREDYSEAHPYSSGYQEVLRALHKRAYLDGNIQKDAGVSETGRGMLRYDGVYYDYQLRFQSEGDGS